MDRLIGAVADFLREDNWGFSEVKSQVDNEFGIITAFEGNSGRFDCLAISNSIQERLVFYSVCPIRVPQEKRVLISEFIARANWDLIIGNFELDFTEGNIRFKTSIDVEGTDLTKPLVKHIIYSNVLTMDRYLPGLMSLLYSEQSPEEAIKNIECEDSSAIA